MSYDRQRAQAFSDHVLDSFNQAASCLMISLGHRAGLFDILDNKPAGTIDEIADWANLDARYVKEWLGAMVCAKIVEMPDPQRYKLPAEHADFLTRRAAPNNLAVFAQYIGLLGTVEDAVLKCFVEGGGVPYDRYERFHTIMAEDSGQTVLPALVDHILPLDPALPHRLESGIEVLDLGCGAGRAVNLLAKRFPRSRFVGLDLSHNAINRARREAADSGLKNARFEARDLTNLHETIAENAYDLITTFDAVHDQAKPLHLLKGIFRGLRQGGTYLMQDIAGSGHHRGDIEHPIGTFLYSISCMHCVAVSLAQKGDGLGAMWGRTQAQDLLKQAGFTDVVVHSLEHDFQNDYYLVRK
ncbi:MAG: class I SAM-dependent methyltransferase [Myxococcales bacterium FL481]|nr:MAG: class I SAM-dependent methyltransferase [Myxococcales bacterium FL481]